MQLPKLKDNNPCFYIILLSATDTDDQVKHMISKIQDEDFDAKVTVIYNDPVDVENLYQDKKIYNIYVFNPDHSLRGDQNKDDDRNSVLYRMF